MPLLAAQFLGSVSRITLDTGSSTNQSETCSIAFGAKSLAILAHMACLVALFTAGLREHV